MIERTSLSQGFRDQWKRETRDLMHGPSLTEQFRDQWKRETHDLMHRSNESWSRPEHESPVPTRPEPPAPRPPAPPRRLPSEAVRDVMEYLRERVQVQRQTGNATVETLGRSLDPTHQTALDSLMNLPVDPLLLQCFGAMERPQMTVVQHVTDLRRQQNVTRTYRLQQEGSNWIVTGQQGGGPTHSTTISKYDDESAYLTSKPQTTQARRLVAAMEYREGVLHYYGGVTARGGWLRGMLGKPFDLQVTVHDGKRGVSVKGTASGRRYVLNTRHDVEHGTEWIRGRFGRLEIRGKATIGPDGHVVIDRTLYLKTARTRRAIYAIHQELAPQGPPKQVGSQPGG